MLCKLSKLGNFRMLSYLAQIVKSYCILKRSFTLCVTSNFVNDTLCVYLELVNGTRLQDRSKSQ